MPHLERDPIRNSAEQDERLAISLASRLKTAIRTYVWCFLDGRKLTYGDNTPLSELRINVGMFVASLRRNDRPDFVLRVGFTEDKLNALLDEVLKGFRDERRIQESKDLNGETHIYLKW